MDIAYISALSALAGSVVGGLTSGYTTWLIQRVQVKAERRAHNQAHREDLYKEFIVEASKAYGDALVSCEPSIPQMVTLYALTSRIRVISTPRTVACAEAALTVAVRTYFEPKKSALEMHNMMKGGKVLDPLRDFSEAARAEMV